MNLPTGEAWHRSRIHHERHTWGQQKLPYLRDQGDWLPLTVLADVEDRTIDVCEEALIRVLVAQVDAALEDLPSRSKWIIVERYGLRGREPHTHDQVGLAHGVTGARISQIEADSIRRLRHLVGAPK